MTDSQLKTYLKRYVSVRFCKQLNYNSIAIDDVAVRIFYENIILQLNFCEIYFVMTTKLSIVGCEMITKNYVAV